MQLFNIFSFSPFSDNFPIFSRLPIFTLLFFKFCSTYFFKKWQILGHFFVDEYIVVYLPVALGQEDWMNNYVLGCC